MASEVIPRLYLGNRADSESFGAHADLVVNCTTDLPFHGCSSTQSQIRLSVKDNGDPRQQQAFVEHVRSHQILERIAEVNDGPLMPL
jgi:hypothetical protein